MYKNRYKRFLKEGSTDRLADALAPAFEHLDKLDKDIRTTIAKYFCQYVIKNHKKIYNTYKKTLLKYKEDIDKYLEGLADTLSSIDQIVTPDMFNSEIGDGIHKVSNLGFPFVAIDADPLIRDNSFVTDIFLIACDDRAFMDKLTDYFFGLVKKVVNKYVAEELHNFDIVCSYGSDYDYWYLLVTFYPERH